MNWGMRDMLKEWTVKKLVVVEECCHCRHCVVKMIFSVRGGKFDLRPDRYVCDKTDQAVPTMGISVDCPLRDA